MIKRITITHLLILSSLIIFGQTKKIPLTHSVYDSWNDIQNPNISNNGEWIIYEINPQDGDGDLWLSNSDKSFQKNFIRGYRASISANSNFVVYQIKPQKSVTKKAKVDKKKKEDMPKDSIGIYTFDNNKTTLFGKVKSYKIGEKSGNWIAIYVDDEKENTPKDSSKSEGEKPSRKKSKSDKNDKLGKLILLNPLNNQQFEYNKVTDYTVSKDGSKFLFSSMSNDTLKNSIVQLFDTQKGEVQTLFTEKGETEGLSLDYHGNQLAFLFSADTGKVKIYDLYYYISKNSAPQKLITSETLGMPKDWVVSENYTPYFSDSGNRLFIGTMPRPIEEPKDTITDDEKVILDLWSWSDTLLQTQQLVNLKREAKKSYLAVYHLKEKQLIQLADKNIPKLRIGNNGDALFTLGEDSQPYLYSMTWDTPTRNDFYQIDIRTGKRTLIVAGNPFNVSLSPSGEFAAYYQETNNAWYSWSAKDKKATCLTANLNVNFYNEDNDVPQTPYPYGFAGWIEGDKYFVVYDKFDLWALDPSSKKAPICLTNGKGRENNVVYRYQKTDPDADYINMKESMLLSSFNKTNKKDGFCSVSVEKPNVNHLIKGDYMIRFIKKAENANKVIWQRETYTEYRDVWTSNLQFENPTKLSDANPQMVNYKWGTVELVSWIDFNRDSVQGLLYKPENFDPNKKYPMMVYFYETHTDDLHSHYEPKPGRSVICPTLYASNDYVVFFPDIKYKTGTPGKSAYDAVISGTMAMINKGFIDKDRIGVQGQSWGGYQIAYLVTQTDLFKAASAGAPVSNMTSAYGGIRWESGLSRMFQYEHTQSRIGGTLWEKPLNYIENSPLFYAPRVNTPLLIRHDDADGAVPWYQGIEYFLALRRLGKQVWMVNYNDEPHNLVRRANRTDWAIRMMQFFDYYLKDTPEPKWMKEGIPAEKKGKELGYDLE
ncbi:MAG: alpha/beta hydrolase family protein [Bacteroidales bacterium]